MTTLVWNTNSRLVPTNPQKSVLFNNESGWQGKISGKALEIIQNLKTRRKVEQKDLDQVPEPIVKLLLDKRILIEQKEAKSYYQGVNKHIRNRLFDHWGLIILPTERCNFACPYCYEERVKGKMKPEIADATDALVARMARESERFSLGFFGGEPLLAPNLVLRFLKTGYENAPDKKTFSGSITTNGSLLTQDMIAEFGAHKLLNYQITLDGPRTMHDMQRPTKGGKETFDKVLQSFDLLYHSGIENLSVTLRVNVHPHLAPRYRPLLDEPLIKKVLSDKRFHLDLHEIWGSDKFILPDIEDPQEAQAAWNNISRNMYGEVNTWKNAKSQHLNTICGDACYAGKPNQYVIYPTGDVGKCTVILEDERNTIGKLGPGGKLLLNEAKHDFWVKQNALVDDDCQKCAYRITCAGIGCPLNRIKPGDGTCTLREGYDRIWGKALGS